MHEVAKFLILCILSIPVVPQIAHAYVGPGLGAGTIGVILGIIGSIFIAIFAIVWYPLKRLLKKKKQNNPDGQKADN
jgi:preprotein translocase subunit SecF